MAEMKAEDVTTQIFDLYQKHGNNDYIGEPISQQSHMIQCAMLAEKEGFSDEIILGAFLHDIGHLLGIENSLKQMGEVGTKDHELIGEHFLEELGFSKNVTNFVRGHVDAKRYLVFKYSDYYDKVLIILFPEQLEQPRSHDLSSPGETKDPGNKVAVGITNQLSPSSKETLVHQGGPMAAEEAETFEKLPVFDALLKMRKWDDLGKDPNAQLNPLEKYETMCKKYLENIFYSTLD